jgi:hypothetical protein
VVSWLAPVYEAAMITFDFIRHGLATSLPNSTFSIAEEESVNGTLFRIGPRNELAAQMSIWLNPYGTCDVLFGRAFSRELELTESALLLSLADATNRGCIEEKLWILGKHRLYSKSVIDVRGKRFICREGIPFVYPLWLRKTFRYQPYR